MVRHRQFFQFPETLRPSALQHRAEGTKISLITIAFSFHVPLVRMFDSSIVAFCTPALVKPSLCHGGVKTSQNIFSTHLCTNRPTHRKIDSSTGLQSGTGASHISNVASTGDVTVEKQEHPKPVHPPLPSPRQRFYDFSSNTINAIRIRHCRVFDKELAKLVERKVKSKESTLSDMSFLVSECITSKAVGGDAGWYTVPLKPDSELDPIVGHESESSSRNIDIRHTAMHPELVREALSARAGALQTIQFSYGWEIFVVEDVRHAVIPSFRGASRTRGFPVTPNMRQTSKKKPTIDPMSYFIQTFGCQMNVSDSERIASELQRRGYHETLEPKESAIYLLNTCALRDHAEQKVYSYLGPHAQRKWDAPSEVTLIVAGCVAQQEGERLLSRVPELDIVMGPQYANRIGEVLDDFHQNLTQIVAVDPIHIQEDISKPIRSSKLTAWVNVIYGCLEKCSYCVVPNTRGLEQSRSMEAIRKEIEGLASEGYREVVLLGQNVDAYGRDFYPKRTFADLLRYVHDVNGIERIRFTTGHPRYISENLLTTVSELTKVMEHFHIPPQSGDNGVLKEMGRGYTRERYISIAKRIRAKLPDASICADTIVGFPGESDGAFENTVSLADEVVFDSNMVRAYSARPNTPAGLRSDQVDEAVKAERLGIMNRKMREQAEIRSRRYLGRTVEVLVEGLNPKNSEEVMGRERSNRMVFFKGCTDTFQGQIVNVLVSEAFAFSLRGRVVSNPR